MASQPRATPPPSLAPTLLARARVVHLLGWGAGGGSRAPHSGCDTYCWSAKGRPHAAWIAYWTHSPDRLA